MDILIVGSGGREHALAWKIRQSPLVERVWVAPGNAGIATCATCVPLHSDDTTGLAEFALQHGVGLVIVGPEEPLTKGIADVLRARGLLVVGPGGAGARLEGSKSFAKGFCERHEIPTARGIRCEDAGAALAHMGDLGFPVVVKADGLAAGKGVIIATTQGEAVTAVQSLAGRGPLLLEEFLRGRECSLLFLCDGKTVVPFAPARDYKRAGDGDMGLNTGGMGSFSSVPDVTSAVQRDAYEHIALGVLAGLADEQIDYRGVLYVGCMVTREGLKVLEFNCRFGDPETQVLMPRIQGDLVPALVACAEGRLADARLEWRDETVVCVQMVSRGYPAAPVTGMTIRGLDTVPQDVLVFHGGTRQQDGRLVTAGGRVLGVTAIGATMAEARTRAYAGVSTIHFEGAQWRTDIASGMDATREGEQT
ncbi:MAG: phosphoribosylamine--glycine ligase [Coprothermobacter sp.]|nr:phosphoribosylamine--glycine ligase [Coprothermobacter sp.]